MELEYCQHKLNVADPEAVLWKCSVEKVFLEISQNSQKNERTRVLLKN